MGGHGAEDRLNAVPRRNGPVRNLVPVQCSRRSATRAVTAQIAARADSYATPVTSALRCVSLTCEVIASAVSPVDGNRSR